VTPTVTPNSASTAGSFYFGGATPIMPEPIDLDRIERAVAQVILSPQNLDSIAKEAHLSTSELRTHCDRYRKAGRAALQ
jgi:coproporphyrinogen III oxidase-like Fe-S oxidoreductase